MNKACAAARALFRRRPPPGSSAWWWRNRRISPVGHIARGLGRVYRLRVPHRQAQAEGYPEDISAGHPLLKNYLNKVKGGKPVGQKMCSRAGSPTRPWSPPSRRSRQTDRSPGARGGHGRHRDGLIAKTPENKLTAVRKTQGDGPVDASCPGGQARRHEVSRAFVGLHSDGSRQGKRCAACANNASSCLVTPEGKKLVWANGDLHNKSIPKELMPVENLGPSAEEKLAKDISRARPRSPRRPLRERFTLWAKTHGRRTVRSFRRPAAIVVRTDASSVFRASTSGRTSLARLLQRRGLGRDLAHERQAYPDLAKQHLNIDPACP